MMVLIRGIRIKPTIIIIIIMAFQKFPWKLL